VLTDPIPAKGKVVCVNLTTLDDDCVDDECILERADYSWIKEDHPTAVAFSFAQAYDVEKLNRALSDGLLKLASPSVVSAATFQKIRSSAKTALQLDDELRALL
jgi:hypothetical protein